MIDHDSNIPKYKSYIIYYGLIWFILIMLVLLVRGYIIKNIKGGPETLITIFLFLTFIFFVIINLYEGNRFSGYLKKYHHENWVNMTSFMGVEGARNDFKSLEFIFSDDNLDDPNIKILKSIQKKLLFFYPTVFITFLIVLFIVLYNCY